MSAWNETNRGRSRVGFTIIELIVAIAVTVILVLGISRIFTTTKTVVSTGQAIAELNQYGRSLERLMRHDFQNMTRDGFLVIRNERIGLPNISDDGQTDMRVRSSQNIRPVYFNEEAWKKDNPDTNNKPDDMGLNRIDQIVFYSVGDYGSYQYQNAYSTGQSNSIIARNDVATAARIWYGQALRTINIYNPSLNAQQQETQKAEIKTAPGLNGYRSKFADIRFDPKTPLKGDGTFRGDGANFYAENWILARQAAPLLRRESVFGSNTTQRGSYNLLSFVPSFIEYFNEQPSSVYYDRFSFAAPALNALPLTDWKNYATMRRRLSPGYVDIIDMDLSEVEKTVTDYGWVQLETGTFFAGKQPGEIANIFDPVGRNAVDVSDWSLNAQEFQNYGTTGTRQDPLVYSYVSDINDRNGIGRDISEFWVRGQMLRMALATGRIRSETSTPSLTRYDQMLTHATLTPGCSNFEVAWSTGQVDYPSGELVWYDIDQPANPYAEGYFPGTDGRETEGANTRERRERAPVDPKIWYLSEIPAQALAGTTPFSGINLWAGNGVLRETQPEDLYYATFGYFVPKVRVGWDKRIQGIDRPGEVREDRSEPWPWPAMIRIRLTLHDQRGRIPGGRSFEFIFKLPKPTQG